MWNSNIKFIYCFVFLFLYGLLYSSKAYCINGSKKTIVVDSSKVAVREPSPEKEKELLNNKDYQYDHIGPAPKTPWERFKEWFWRKVDDIFSTKGGSIGLNILKYLLIVAAIVLIILLLLKNNVRALFYGKSASVAIDFKEFEEDIHKINFNELITIALAEKNFRRAIRLHFLKLLKELTDKNLIVWKIDKTNNDYSIELVNSKYSKSFKELILLYEYVWYGSFELDETNFKTIIEKFNLFEI